MCCSKLARVELTAFSAPKRFARPQYVASYHNKAGLLGATKEDAARVQQWCLWANITLLPSIGAWFAPLLGRKPYTKQGEEAAKTALFKQTDYLEKALATRTFLVGDRISIADIFVASVLTRGFEFVSFRTRHTVLTLPAVPCRRALHLIAPDRARRASS